jgi:putative endonuclease
VDGFAKQHGVQKEKRVKKWNRAWKIRLIEEMNPEWKDLSGLAF